VHFDHFDVASYDYYESTANDAEDLEGQIGKHDAIYCGRGPAGRKIPDHISLWGSLIKIPPGIRPYVILRPVR